MIFECFAPETGAFGFDLLSSLESLGLDGAGGALVLVFLCGPGTGGSA